MNNSFLVENSSWIREAVEDYGCDFTYCSYCEISHDDTTCQGND